MSIIVKPNPSELTWEVNTEKLYNQRGQSLSDYKMLTRSDNGALLNVCKKSYSPTLNSKFKNTVKQMSEITGFGFEGYVEAYGGKRIFAYLKSEGRKIAGFDFDNYMVIGNSHDYSSGFFIASVHEMLRCQNQWSKLKKGSLYTIPHTASCDGRIDELVMRFDNYMEELNRTKRSLEIWKEIEISQTLREMMIERVVNIEYGKEESIPTRTQNRIESVELAINRETKDVGENLLGLFQGVTYYTTHLLSQRNHVYGNILGNAYSINERAREFCESVVDGTLDNIDLNFN